MKITVDENGGLVPIDHIADQNGFSVETHTEYLKTTTASSEASPTCPMLIEKISVRRKQTRNEIMCVQGKARFFFLI